MQPPGSHWTDLLGMRPWHMDVLQLLDMADQTLRPSSPTASVMA